MTETILTQPDCTPSAAQAMDTGPARALAATLKALADPLRLRILSAIAADPRGESCVCDLTGLAPVSQPTISHHLKVLKEEGVLESERRGTWVWYRITAHRRAAMTTFLDAFAPAAISSPGGAPGTGTEAAEADAAELDTRVDHLADELAETTTGLDGETVRRLVRDSYVALARSARITRHLIPLTERFAKQRLADLVREHDPTRPQVLFVCVANAGRSQLAAALTHHLSQGQVRARSAGSTPAADIHPQVRTLIEEIDGSGQTAFPKPLTDEAVRAADVVITMGCGDVCPIIPGVRYEDWAVADPALASAAGVAAIRDDIAARVRTLLDSLPTTTHRSGAAP
ncbi:MAG TPA: metalloregulator ArsR/SmtB family transcription factor [Candidatus Ruania gallistercoris]|uniref:Metalloregulator ArsR/SmtB family transcription factor n=1 Tax=Candidatus Ruania gallistercoris TaxID=2838746 RepID=A0A9D2EFG5_9MICO|nr:metalloregulator ArsR/SmtB family transcription factor [Candidatus Ruania gallistercoris]